MFKIQVDQSCFVGHWVMLWFLFWSCFLLTVGYHLQLQMPVWPFCLHQRIIAWMGLLESERGRESEVKLVEWVGRGGS